LYLLATLSEEIPPEREQSPRGVGC